jgi:hypothetical protein
MDFPKRLDESRGGVVSSLGLVIPMPHCWSANGSTLVWLSPLAELGTFGCDLKVDRFPQET